MMRKILRYTVWSQLLLAGCALLTSCSEDALTDLIMGGKELPAGAVPAEQFNPSIIEPEPMAQNAAQFVIDDAKCPYRVVELLGDGKCILVPNAYFDFNKRPSKKPAAKVTKQADGSVVVSELNVMRSPETRDGEDSCVSGSYSLEYDGIHLYFDNGVSIRLEETEGNTYRMHYTDGNRISTVYCTKTPDPEQGSDAARSICRTWDTLYWDFWLVYKDKARVHVNYNAETEQFSGDVNDGFSDDEEQFEFDETGDSGMMAYKVTFSPYGTYICYFRNNNTGMDTVDVRNWRWEDPAQGILHWDLDSEIDNSTSRGYVTVRFAGNMMRIYEQYTDTQDGMTCDMYIVNTFRASVTN